MRFSVIIPLYNKSPYIEKALRSVLAQTFKDYELIVVDDGSQDDSASIAESVLTESIAPFKIIRQENAGVSSARNRGVDYSQGEILCFLDADDWWAPNFLERIDWLIQEYPDAGIWGTNYYYVKNGRMKVCVKTAETGYINYCKVYSSGMAMPLTSISVAVKPHVFEEFRGFNPKLRMGEDFDLWIKIALSYRVAFLDEPLAFYNQDVDLSWRAIGHLTNPSVHMLWNLGYLEDEEKNNPDFKQLIDNLRAYGLFPYYLSRQYRAEARKELEKIDWENQPEKTKALYRQPVPFLRIRQSLLKVGSFVKQLIMRPL